MYTYELTPNLKTKSYRILDNGVEVYRSLAKKTARAMCDTINKLQTALKEAENHVKSITQPAPSEHHQSSNAGESDAALDSTSVGDNNPGISRNQEGVLSARAQYFADAQLKLSASIKESAATGEQYGREAEQHKIEAEQHGKNAEQHRKNAEQHGRNAEQYKREAEQHKRNAAILRGFAEQLAVITGEPLEEIDISGAYLELPCRVIDKNGCPAITGRDDHPGYRTIDTRAI